MLTAVKPLARPGRYDFFTKANNRITTIETIIEQRALEYARKKNKAFAFGIVVTSAMPFLLCLCSQNFLQAMTSNYVVAKMLGLGLGSFALSLGYSKVVAARFLSRIPIVHEPANEHERLELT